MTLKWIIAKLQEEDGQLAVGQLLINMGINLSALRSGGAQAIGILNNLRNAAGRAAGSLAQGFNFGPATQNIRALGGATEGLSRIVATIGAGRAVRELAALSDQAILLDSRVRNVTKSEEEFNQVNEELFQIAQRSRTSLEGVVTIYTRLARSNEQIGASQAQLLRITETLNKTTVVYGNTTQEATGALIQLSQAIASNRLGGDELRTVLEQLPPVAAAIAKEMGTTVGALRDLGREGKITPQIVAQAILNMGKEIDEQFKKIPTTIGQVFTQLNNEALKTVANLNKITDAGPKTAGVINSIADAMGKIREGGILRAFKILIEFGPQGTIEEIVDRGIKKLEELREEAKTLEGIKLKFDEQGLDTKGLEEKIREVNLEVERLAKLLGSEVAKGAKTGAAALREELQDIEDNVAAINKEIEITVKTRGADAPELDGMRQVLNRLKEKAIEVKEELGRVGDKIPKAVDTAEKAFKKALDRAEDLADAIDGLEGKEIPIELQAEVNSLAKIRKDLFKAVEDAKTPEKKIKALIDLKEFDAEIKKIPDPVAQRKIGIEVDTQDAINRAKDFVSGLEGLGEKPIPLAFETEAESLEKIKQQLIDAVEQAPTPRKKIEAVAALNEFIAEINKIPDPVLKRKILTELELKKEKAEEDLESFKIEAEAKKIGLKLTVDQVFLLGELKRVEQQIDRLEKIGVPVPIELLIKKDKYIKDLKRATSQSASQEVELVAKFNEVQKQAEIAKLKVDLKNATTVEMAINIQRGINRAESELDQMQIRQEGDPIIIPADIDPKAAEEELKRLRAEAEKPLGIGGRPFSQTVGDAATPEDIANTVDTLKGDIASAISSGDVQRLIELQRSANQYLASFSVGLPADVKQQIASLVGPFSELAAALRLLGASGFGGGSTFTGDPALSSALRDLKAQQAEQLAATQETNGLIAEGNQITASAYNTLTSGGFAATVLKKQTTATTLAR